MLYIRKRKTPVYIKQAAEKLKSAEENRYNELCLPDDAGKLRSIFEDMPRSVIGKALCTEQHGLCAYCMSQIRSEGKKNIRIEHYKALSRNKETALDYQNFLGVCSGGEKEGKGKSHILCCDAARKETELTINPWDKRQMQAIGYRRNGQIFVHADPGLAPQLVEKMQTDMDEILMLNGKLDADGKTKFDTSTRLVASRRSIYQSVCTQFERWDRKKCLTADFLQEKINALEKELQGDETAEPFIGVRLYWYRRKCRQLSSRK